MPKTVTITLSEDLGDYVLSTLYAELASTEAFLAKNPDEGGPEHPDEEGEALRDRDDAKASIAVLSEAMGYADGVTDPLEEGYSPEVTALALSAVKTLKEHLEDPRSWDNRTDRYGNRPLCPCPEVDCGL